MHYFPQFPLHINASIIFSLLILLGLIGGELASKSRFFPEIFGYIAVGFLVGPSGFNVVDQSILDQTRIFIDISLGLILFAIGRHLDFRWLRSDLSLLSMSIAEFTLTFVLILITLLLIGLPWLPAALAANIAGITSPAVVMLVTHDLGAKGPVTRRILILTSLNNFFGLALFTILLPIAQPGVSALVISSHIAYQIFGAIITAFIMLIVTKTLAKLTKKRPGNQFILFVGSTILAIGLARIMHLSTMMTLFLFGVAARNFDPRHRLGEVDFGAWGRVFLILLFVLTGISLQIQGMWKEIAIVIAFILVRLAAKSAGVYLFSKTSRLSGQQIFSLSLALTPMAGVAIGMSYMLTDLNPELGNSLAIIISGVLAILTLVGPIAIQFALLRAGEFTND